MYSRKIFISESELALTSNVCPQLINNLGAPEPAGRLSGLPPLIPWGNAVTSLSTGLVNRVTQLINWPRPQTSFFFRSAESDCSMLPVLIVIINSSKLYSVINRCYIQLLTTRAESLWVTALWQALYQTSGSFEQTDRQTDSKAKESREIGQESPLSILVTDQARVDEVQTDPVGSHLPPKEPTSCLDQSPQSMKPSDGSSGPQALWGFQRKKQWNSCSHTSWIRSRRP